MLFIAGALVVIGCVIGGYVWHHGKLEVLWQPNEFLIIAGAAFGSFLISSQMKLVKKVGKSLKYLFKSTPYKKKDYIELLTLLYNVFKLLRSKGLLEMESHIEKPEESALFSQYPNFLKNKSAVVFLCDYLRVMTMGVEDYYQIEELMERDLDVHRKEHDHISHALLSMGDAMPALGIVAAVLGVITTMQSITEPPEILGGLIGAALVGTFLGVLLSYGFVSPIGRLIGAYYEDIDKYLECIKVAMLSHLKGNAPVVSVEFARNSLNTVERPAFIELEEAINSSSAGAGAQQQAA